MNLEQLNAMTDLELDEAVALAQGWKYHIGKIRGDWWATSQEEEIEDYHPTANTTEGKAACFDLMDKFNLTVDFDTGLVHWDDGWTIYNANPQRAICEAVILSAQEK